MSIKTNLHRETTMLWRMRNKNAGQSISIEDALHDCMDMEATPAMLHMANTVLNIATDKMQEVLEQDIKDRKDKCGMNIIEIEQREEKGELAKRLYPNMIIDCAVPQHFINRCYERGFDDAARHFVTAYSNHAYDNPKAGMENMTDGNIVPITNEGIYICAILAQFPQ